jgi:hypothetical protein
VTTTTDWWADLYDAPHGDTLAATTPPPPAPAGDRLPPPGQVVNLDDAAAPDTDDDETDEEQDAYEEFDNDELADDDETDDEDQADVRPSRAARLHPRQVRAYLVEQHGEQRQRWRYLAYNGSAAYAGWALGWEGSLHGLLVDCGRETGDPLAAIILGLAVVGLARAVIDRRTRGWWSGLAWVCRIPLASAVLALALYTPAMNL